jgi:DNA-binding Lrp family transcriptional regulator
MSNIRGQDILVLLKLLAKELQQDSWSYQQLADELDMSSSEVHAALKRARKSNLVDIDKRYVIHSALLEYLLHGLKYCFPAEEGRVCRGMPTGYAAHFMQDEISAGNDLPPVWSHPEGKVKGVSLKPIYRSVPDAAKKDKRLYRFLVLADLLRCGNARERKFAETEFLKVLNK